MAWIAFYLTLPITKDLGLEVLAMSWMRNVKCVVTDSHFLIPFVVLLFGIGLLVVLH